MVTFEVSYNFAVKIPQIFTFYIKHIVAIYAIAKGVGRHAFTTDTFLANIDTVQFGEFWSIFC